MKINEIISNFLFELYEIQRNFKTRRTIQQIKRENRENLTEFFRHQSLQSAFRYRISHDPGMYQHLVLEVASSPEFQKKTKQEILEIFSSPLFEEENHFTGKNDIVGPQSTIPEKKCYEITSENFNPAKQHEAHAPTCKFLLECLEIAEKKGLTEYLIPIQALIYKYSFDEATDFLLYPADLPFSNPAADGYQKEKSLKSKWRYQQLNYTWKKLRFAARYLKETEYSEGSNFLFFFNISIIEIPEIFTNFCRNLYNIVTDNKISEENIPLYDYPIEFQLFTKYAFAIACDKWFEQKELQEKIVLLNSHFKYELTDSMIQNYYRNTEEWDIFSIAQDLLQNNFLLESRSIFGYLGHSACDESIRKISDVSAQAVSIIFEKDDPMVRKNFVTLSRTTIQEISGPEENYLRFNFCLLYPYIQNSYPELDGIFRFNALGFSTPFEIAELSVLAKNRTFKDFWAYVNIQKKCFQFETAIDIFSISARRGCIGCKRFIGEMQYNLGNVEAAISCFNDVLNNSNSTFPDKFQAQMILGIIQFERGEISKGIQLLKSNIFKASDEQKLDSHFVYVFYRVTIRGLLRIYPENKICEICEQFINEFQSKGQKKNYIYTGLGNALFDHACFEESKKYLNLVINDGKNDIAKDRIYVAIGMINSNQGNFIDAIKCYSMALKTLNKEPELYRMIALNHAALNEYSLASSSLDKAVEINPSNDDYKQVKKIYESLSIKEGVYLSRIKDKKIFSMFYTAESQYFNELDDKNNFATIFNQYGAGVEVLLKNKIANPMREELLKKIEFMPLLEREQSLRLINENKHLYWLQNFIINHSDNFELGTWRNIEKDIAFNGYNPIIKMVDDYLRNFFGTKEAKNQIPDKIVKSIENIREERNPADHGAHYTIEDANRKKSKVVKSVNTLILFFYDRDNSI